MSFRRAAPAASVHFASATNSSSSAFSQSQRMCVYEDENEPGSSVSATRRSPRDFVSSQDKRLKEVGEGEEGDTQVGVDRQSTASKEELSRIESYPDGGSNCDHFPFYPPILENAASSYRNIHCGNGYGPASSSSSTSTSSIATLRPSAATAALSSSSGYLEDSVLPSMPPVLNPAFSRQGSADFFGRGLEDDTDDSQYDGEHKSAPIDEEDESSTRSLYFARQPSMERTNSSASTLYNGFDDETTRSLQFSPPDDDDTTQEMDMKQSKSISPFDAPTYQPSTPLADRTSSVATTITSGVSRASSFASTFSPRSTTSNVSAASAASATLLPTHSLGRSTPPQAGTQLSRTTPSPSLTALTTAPPPAPPTAGSRSPAMSNPLPSRPPVLLTHPSAHSLHHSSVPHSLSSSALDSSLQDMSLADADSEDLPPPSHLVLTLRRQNAMISEEHNSPMPEGPPSFPIRGASYSSSSSRTVSHSSNRTNGADTWASSYSAASSPSALGSSTFSSTSNNASATSAGAASTPSSSASNSSMSASSISASSDGSSSSSSSSRTNS